LLSGIASIALGASAVQSDPFFPFFAVALFSLLLFVGETTQAVSVRAIGRRVEVPKASANN